MSLRGIAICSALMLAGCAHSSVVLLPEEDGGHGEIALLPKDGKGGETVMKDANSRATLNGAQPSIRPLGASGLKPNEAALLASLPPPAKSFTLYFHEGTTEVAPESHGALNRYARRSRSGPARRSRSRDTRTRSAAMPTTTCCHKSGQRKS